MPSLFYDYTEEQYALLEHALDLLVAEVATDRVLSSLATAGEG